MPGSAGIRKASLRRALWSARLASKAIADEAFLPEPERYATLALRAAVRQQLQPEEGAELDGCSLYRVENSWQAELLQRDPEILHAETIEELAAMLAQPEPLSVFASRAVLEELARRKVGRPENAGFKTVFVDFA